MRARLAIAVSGQQVALRGILLKDKPAPFLDASSKGTVPVLAVGDRVIDESRDVMTWALTLNDPDGWLDLSEGAMALIDECDGPFKTALDHTKYAVRFPELDGAVERGKALSFLRKLDDRLQSKPHLSGPRLTLADAAILPFVRQFANTDRAWFEDQGLDALERWLDAFLGSTSFAKIMVKHPPWRETQEPVIFPT